MKHAWLLTVFFSICACSWYILHTSRAAHNNDTRLHIVCTTSIIADTVLHITGDHARITCLMGPDIDPHLYKAREHDVYALASADIIFYNGLHLEGKIAEILGAMNEYVPSIGVADALDRSLLIPTEEYENMYDPHIWFDVRIWMRIVEIITETLCIHDPTHCDEYQKNSADYLQQLASLDAHIAQQIASLDPAQRTLITAHDAFHYFGRAYGVTVLALQGISTDSEAGIKDVQNLVDYIVEHHIRAIFVEASIPERNIHAVQDAVHMRGWHIDIGDELYSDALGPQNSGAESYINMVTHNIHAIISGISQK